MHVRPRQTSASRVRGCSRSRTCVRPPSLVKVAFTAGVLAAATIGLVPQAHAQLQNAPVDLEIFRPAMDSKGFVTVNSSAVLGQWDLSFGLVTSYARRPLQFTGAGTFGAPQTNTFSVDTLVRPSLQARGRLPEPPAPRRRARHHRPDGHRRRARARPNRHQRQQGVDVRQPGPGRHPDPPQAALPERDPPAASASRSCRRSSSARATRTRSSARGRRSSSRRRSSTPSSATWAASAPPSTPACASAARPSVYTNNAASFTTPPMSGGADITTGGSIEVKNEVLGGARPLVRHRAAEVRPRRRAVRQLRPRFVPHRRQPARRARR